MAGNLRSCAESAEEDSEAWRAELRFWQAEGNVYKVSYAHKTDESKI